MGVTITKLSELFHVSYKTVVVKQCLLHSVADKKSTETRKKNERRCRNGVPKSTQTRNDKSDVIYKAPSLHL